MKKSKGRTSFARILAIAVSLSVMLSVMPFTSNIAFAAENKDYEPNNYYPGNAATISLGTLYEGTHMYNPDRNKDEDYYKFTVSQTGYITLSFKYETRELEDFYCVLYDKNNKAVIPFHPFSKDYLTSLSKNKVLVPKGTYYLEIGGYNDYEEAGEKYQFKVNYTKATNVPGASRLWGRKALDTMAAITKEFSSFNSNGIAVLTTNTDFKDALAASSLAGLKNAPILMTAKDSLSPQTKKELTRMGANRVYVVGSTNEISKKVADELVAMGIGVLRLSGKTASERAINIAYEIVDADLWWKQRSVAIITTQNSFKDALSIAPYAYVTQTPIIYLEPNQTLSSKALNYLKSHVQDVIIVGGPQAVPAAVEDQLIRNAGFKKKNITRLAGANAYKTSLVIAEWETGKIKKGTNSSSGNLYKYCNVTFTNTDILDGYYVGVATGKDWYDALAASALCGQRRSVLLLADDSNYSNTSFVKNNKKRLSLAVCWIFGGEAAVSPKVYNAFNSAVK